MGPDRRAARFHLLKLYLSILEQGGYHVNAFCRFEKGGCEMASSSDGTVAKALDVLEQIASYGRPVRFAEILEQSALPKATLFRLTQTLVQQGMLRFEPDEKTYAPGGRILKLAHAAWADFSLAPIARRHLQALNAELHQTLHLAQLERGQVLYIDKIVGADRVTMYSQTGKVAPAYCTGIGKAMLAFLEPQRQDAAMDMQSFHRFTDRTLCDAEALRAELAQIRASGFAFDREEHEEGIICVAVPIMSLRGPLIGGLSLTSISPRYSLDQLERFVPHLKEVSARIATDASDWKGP